MSKDSVPTLDRRTLLQLAAGGAGAGAGKVEAAFAAEAPFALTDPRYDELYKATSTYYVNDAQWAAWTRPRLAWPKGGEKVPDLTVVIANIQGTWLDAWRKWAADAEKLGLKYNIQQVSQARWLDLIVSHKIGDVDVHSAIFRT